MKHRSKILLSVLTVMLILTAFMAGKASASTGCFTDTNSHWAETFICWMKDNGITTGTAPGIYSPEDYVTRAQMAVFMQKLATFGDTYTNVGVTAWQPNTINPTANIEYSASQAILQPNAAGTYYYEASIPILSSLHNQQMTIKQVELCYDATHSTIGNVTVYLTSNTGFLNLVDLVADNVSRTDASCRTYSFTNPDLLNGHENLSVVIKLNTASASDYVDIYSLTAVQGTTANAPVLKPASGETGLDIQTAPAGLLHNP